MMPTVLFLSCSDLTRPVISGYRLSLFGAQPPGTTTPSSSEASTLAAVVSACAPSAFLPLTGSVSGPTETTSAPSSCKRITVTQYSRSSKPSATRTAIFFPSNLMATPLVSPSLLCHRPEKLVHLAPRLFATELQGAGQRRHGVGAAPGPEQPIGDLEVLPEAVLQGGHAIRRLLPLYQGENLLPVAGGAAQAHSLDGAQFMDGAGFAGGDLLEVRVVQHDVGRHPLPLRLLRPPAPEDPHPPLTTRRTQALRVSLQVRSFLTWWFSPALPSRRGKCRSRRRVRPS